MWRELEDSPHNSSHNNPHNHDKRKQQDKHHNSSNSSREEVTTMTCRSDDYFSESQPHGWLSLRTMQNEVYYERRKQQHPTTADWCGDAG